MSFLQKVRKTIIEHNLVQQGERIIVGVSGGPDSVCMLHVLNELREEYGLDLVVVHVNHNLRGKASDGDQTYTEKLCHSLGIECRAYSFDVEELAKDWKMSIEEAGRKARYEAFEEVWDTAGGDKIAVAHNQNDQAETLLMRILRGTGTDGMAGIEYMRDKKVIRPLLDITRAEIEKYCIDNKLEPRMDATNEEAIHTRNKIRLELIPFIQQNFSDNIIQNLSKLAKIAQEDKDALYEWTDEIVFKDNLTGWELPMINKQSVWKSVFRKQHISIQKRIILRKFAKIGLRQGIGTIHLDNAIKLIYDDKTSAKMDFPHGYQLRIGYEDIEFLLPSIPEDRRTEDHIMEWEVVTEKPEELPENTKVFDYDKLESDPVLRTRREGDFISPLGMEGTQKLKEFFIDKKIPADMRGQVPLVCVGSQVVWIVGYRISERFKIDEDTKNFILITVRPIV